jgi:DNA-directed RNA polymerase subunit omega
MMRLEERISKALKQVDNDRYILAIAVGQRADELSKGAKPLL